MEIKLQTQALGHTSHVSSALEPQVAGAGQIGPCRHSTFPSVWKVLLDGPEPKHVCILMGKSLDGGDVEEQSNVAGRGERGTGWWDKRVKQVGSKTRGHRERRLSLVRGSRFVRGGRQGVVGRGQTEV